MKTQLTDITFETQLIDLEKTLNWLIDGYGKHGLKISDVHYINWAWIVENYNVDYHSCNHKKVIAVTQTIVVSQLGRSDILEKHYDGFCEICNNMVKGEMTIDNKIIKRWY